MSRQRISRRRMLGLVGITAACALGGAVALLPRTSAPRVVILPTDTSIPTLSILPRSAWGARRPNHNARNERGFYSAANPLGWRNYGADYPDIYRTLVAHHSVIYRHDDRTTLRDVQALHMQDNGWADVGYHFLIGTDGQVYQGRDLQVRGVHVGGFNTGSVGVCLLGDFTRRDPLPAQLESLLMLGRWLQTQLPLTHLAAHSEFNIDTQCPGRLRWFLDDLAARLGLLRGTGGYQGA